MPKPIVVIESPFNGTPEERARNLRYLAWCLKDSLDRGEAPFASHGLYPTAYPEDPEHRAAGIAAGLAVRNLIGFSVFYANLGFSDGMKHAFKSALSTERTIKVRLLPPEFRAAFDRGEWPPSATVRWVPT